jgi:UDP-glucose 4-epimerase
MHAPNAAIPQHFHVKSTMSSILVTGGAGFVGSHTCKALRRAGFDPITYDNLQRGNPESVKWGALEIGDLSNRDRLRDTLSDTDQLLSFTSQPSLMSGSPT